MRSDLLFFLLTVSTIFFFTGCHNNAHIRTQKPLETGETVYSGSAMLPVVTDDDVGYKGIIGMRIEGSLLKGTENNNEVGAYAAFGIGENDPGIVLGLDYKKHSFVLGKHLAKVGSRFELNITDYETVFSSRPSITTTTSKNKNFYGGFHWLFTKPLGKMDIYTNPHTLNKWEKDFISYGPGITIGTESFTQNTSLQYQLDASFVFDRHHQYRNGIKVDAKSGSYVLVTASIGWNLFRPPSDRRASFKPLPPNQQNETAVSTLLSSNTPPLGFDPKTGKPMKNKTIVFDPETGGVTEKTIQTYDPETGEINVPQKSTTQQTEKRTEESQNETPEKQKMTPVALSNSEIVYLANQNAENTHIGPVWGLCGLAGLGTGFSGGVGGALFAYEMVGDEFVFPGLLIGGLLGLSVPPTLAGVTANGVRIVYPENINTTTEKVNYKKAYIKKTRQLRTRSAWNGTGFSFIMGGMGILFAIASF